MVSYRAKPVCARLLGVTTLAGRRCHFSDSVSKLTKDVELKFAIFGADNSGRVDLCDFLSEARRAIFTHVNVVIAAC
jgi:hypothetical protein